MLHGILIIGLLVVTIFFSWLRRDLLSTTIFHKAIFWTCLLVNILLLISAIALVASAAENPTTIEKPTAACPTEFNPNDSAWALHRIDSTLQEKHELYIERIRVFSYLPDPEKQIFINIKKLWNPDCIAKLGSYSSGWNNDGKQVWGIIQTPEKATFFLLQNNDSALDLKTLLRSKPDVWQSGDRITGTFTCENMKECNIKFVLYKENAPIALRVLPIGN